MLKLGLLIITFIANSQVLASETSATTEYKMPFTECFRDDLYVSGEDCYKKYNDATYMVNNWNFIEVPIDYNNRQNGKTKISYRLNVDFDLNKKTVIYFNGGPGGTSVYSDFNQLTDVNVIYFNQRGTAFSRPESKELFLSAEYYSSENTARDALEIIKHLGVKQVTAYGMSYGTVPATIFGSLFPDQTRNVILEGVVYDGSEKLWYGSHRIKLLQKFFDKQDYKLKEKILKYSRNPKVFSGWLSGLAQQLMYSENFELQLKNKLEEIFTVEFSTEVDSQPIAVEQVMDEFIIERLQRYNYANAGDNTDIIWFSPTMFNFIACKELSASEDQASFFAVFNDQNKLVPYRKDANTTNYCKKLNTAKPDMYTAANYPLTVPVYYFQGTTDGATTAEYAVWHYKKSARSKAELVLAKNMGHSVVIQYLSNLERLSEEDRKNPTLVEAENKQLAMQKEVVRVFNSAINNDNLDLSELNNLISDKKSSWVKTQKN